MIFLDVTKASSARHRSGLTRVGTRLAQNFGLAAAGVAWPEWDRAVKRGDWFLTPELFSENERPGFNAFLEARPCRFAAIFHDAIPLKHPHITWPHSVARHPEYMKRLARFDRVWAVSEASRQELTGFWRWQGIETVPPVDVLSLGADFNGAPRVTARRTVASAQLLCVGILEPRKNQLFLLDVCERLWADGLAFELHVVGRVNPHFGAPILARIKTLRRKYRGLRFHDSASDSEVAKLYANARASVFPTIAEGCGLPLLESLWLGVPCLCSDLPVLRENADGGGCIAIAPNDPGGWQAALRAVLTDDGLHARLAAEAASRPLSTWAQAAESIRQALDN
ncbi:MAG TPA: glycosyltransferase family 1 protein [Opitutaceae bacterium]|nr:glycosyltransferase family 1 protein [Opitutaceae bacterium]